MEKKQIEELKEHIKYQNAIIEAQKTFCAIYDSQFRLEFCNTAFASFILRQKTRDKFVLVESLLPYENYELPNSDKDLIYSLEKHDDFKAVFEFNQGNEAVEDFILSIHLSKSILLGGRKYIVVLTDITSHEKRKKDELELFKFKEKYHNKQQEDAFKKEVKIIKDEASHRECYGWFFDSYYKPLDILSGDTYGTVEISDGVFLFYLVDAMGKGLSASVTSIQSSSFINNAIDIAVMKHDYNFEHNIKSFSAYIKKQLLDDEVLCVLFVLLDTNQNSLKYANYGMPPIFMEDSYGNITYLKSNNLPIMSFIHSDKIDEIQINNIEKIAFFTDGLNETMTTSAKIYNNFLQDDFKSTHTLGNFIKMFNNKTVEHDDDVTIIYLKKLEFNTHAELDLDIESTRDDIGKAQICIETYLDEIIHDIKNKMSLSLAISELLSNALEHGNFNISGEEKLELLQQGKLEDKISELEKNPTYKEKRIKVQIYLSRVLQNNTRVLQINIQDSGNGFDFSQKLKQARSPFNAKYNGRGIRMSLDSVGGIYYNSKGKKVTILETIKNT